jgi:hypothetical protein
VEAREIQYIKAFKVKKEKEIEKEIEILKKRLEKIKSTKYGA